MSKQSCIRDVADLNQINRCIDSLKKVESSILKLSDILKLAGNNVRLKILYLLSTEEDLCPCDLSDILDMTVPAVSQHLRKLKNADIVQSRREGKLIFYSLKEPYNDLLMPLFNQIENNTIMEILAA